jgi:SPP1 family predicted phage head-tail adaptor
MNRKVARFNKRITIQKNTVTTDKHLNHVNTWTDYFSCWAYAGTYQFDKEEQGEAQTIPEESVNFEVRYCSELKALTSDGFRVLFNGSIYDIIAVDEMNYQNQSVRIRCKWQKAVSA